jgi:hypothetical protein
VNRGCAAAFAAVYDCEVPVIVAVQGFCLGGGIGIAGNADIVVASDDATFGLPEVDRGALGGLRHAFLIRDPRQLLASYAKVRAEPELADLGLAQQVEIFRRFGGPVVDARDILLQPERTLRALCDALGVPFDPAMLSWPAGPRDTDGVWARYWYEGVWRSTGFGPYRESLAELPPELEQLAGHCQPFYAEMSDHRLKP